MTVEVGLGREVRVDKLRIHILIWYIMYKVEVTYKR